MRRDRDPIHTLRTAIDCLPVVTREAMLQGVRSNDIIVGAYTDRTGGVCPMLAAHRCGGRTDFLSFARAWDSFGRSPAAAPAAPPSARCASSPPTWSPACWPSASPT